MLWGGGSGGLGDGDGAGGRGEHDGAGDAGAAFIFGQAEAAADEAHIFKAQFPAVVAQMRVDEGDVAPANAIERLSRARDGQIFDANVVRESPRSWRRQYFRYLRQRRGIEVFSFQGRGIESLIRSQLARSLQHNAVGGRGRGDFLRRAK